MTGTPPVLLVGYAGDDLGEQVLDRARWLGSAMSAVVHVVHVTALDDYPLDPDGMDWEAEARRELVVERATVERAFAEYSGQWTYDQVPGVPAEVLAETADRVAASIVVVGAHVDGASATLHRFVGRSVGRELVHHARWPVLVVPEPGTR